MKEKLIKNIPNILTFSRLIASLGGAISFVIGNIPVATILYIYGALSDCFDGIAARKLNAFSEVGRKLDAFSDKIYAGSLLIPGVLCGNLLLLIPLTLELGISRINLKSEKLGFKPATQRIGKFKTAFLFPTVISGLLATIYPPMYLLFLILLPITTILQKNSLTVYKSILNKNINQKSSNKPTESPSHENNPSIKKVQPTNNYSYNYKVEKLTDELIYYLNNPTPEYIPPKVNTQNKTKVRKP